MKITYKITKYLLEARVNFEHEHLHVLDIFDYLEESLNELNMHHENIHLIPTWKLYIVNLNCDRLILNLFDIICVHESKVKSVYKNKSVKIKATNSYLSYYSSDCDFVESYKSSILNNKYSLKPKLYRHGKSYMEIMSL